MKKDKIKEELKILLINGSAIAGAYALKRITEKVVERGMQKRVPANPEDNTISWTEALGWAAFTGAMAGTIKLLIKRGAKLELDKVF